MVMGDAEIAAPCHGLLMVMGDAEPARAANGKSPLLDFFSRAPSVPRGA